MTTATILDCGHAPSGDPRGPGTGYGQDSEGNTYCYSCCADRERTQMIETGRATLYLIPAKETAHSRVHATVTDWPGYLRFPIIGTVRKGRHNMARVRYDFDFTGPDNAHWVGTQYGDNTQIAHCRRVKS